MNSRVAWSIVSHVIFVGQRAFVKVSSAACRSGILPFPGSRTPLFCRTFVPLLSYIKPTVCRGQERRLGIITIAFATNLQIGRSSLAAE